MKQLLLIPLLILCLPANADTYCGTGSGSIPDGSGTLTWTIEVPETTTITTKVLLMTRITHPWMGDLSLRLTAPDGTTALLLDRPGIQDSLIVEMNNRHSVRFRYTNLPVIGHKSPLLSIGFRYHGMS